ncbi:AAA family ATPase [Paenibacillus odorifer]|uniref:AAA family ATPase n=1 Tax=Paenibacillus odorifer TaxID=189426 RepID=UPI00096F19AF|nr:AAA family ATPase [Paenibacillus odorifer]OMD06629.1 hypothetical protein BJP47_13585 [Paenibacillus odorifer]
MIKTIYLEGLNSKISGVYDIHPDINIITGKNGAGKTSFLKLVWYLLSGHISLAINEIDFKFVAIEGDDFKISLEKIYGNKSSLTEEETDIEDVDLNEFIHICLYSKNEKIIDTKLRKENIQRGPRRIKLAEIENTLSQATSKSVFFPTFRRIEYNSLESPIGGEYVRNPEQRFHNAVRDFAEHLSNKNHQFITSISTKDVVDLMTSEFARISNEFIKMNVQFSEHIRKDIVSYRQTNRNVKEKASLLEDATDVLNGIMDRLDYFEKNRERLLNPFSQLSRFIEEVFEDKSIKITEDILLGYQSEVMQSDKLSAGEQQMLSFLCYNAFLDKSSIFIDEPELSLHVDWQRELFPLLISQGKSNQFFVATHSPFIYSRYESNELVLTENKGW